MVGGDSKSWRSHHCFLMLTQKYGPRDRGKGHGSRLRTRYVKVFSSYLKGFERIWRLKVLWLSQENLIDSCFIFQLLLFLWHSMPGVSNWRRCLPAMIFLLPCWDVFCQHCLGTSMLDLETQKVFWTASEELLSEHTSQEIVSKRLEEKEH